jgi:hypothetical protein
MPHKYNADRRHHIPKMSFKVRNWPAYEAGLRRRGSLTLLGRGRSAGMLAERWSAWLRQRFAFDKWITRRLVS